MTDIIKATSNWLWGYPMLIMVLGVGLFYLVRLRAVQVRFLPEALRAVMGSRTREAGADGDVSPFGALMTSVGGIVGNGNIAGVATAITAGGPGALFWMWVSALLGGGTMFAEGVLGVHTREKGADGVYVGGPMYYMRDIWKPLAVFYALGQAFRICTSTTTIQANSIASVIDSELGIDPWIACVVTAAVTGFVVVGGVRQIGRVMEVLAPFMGILYLSGALFVMLYFIGEVPRVLWMVVESAFTPAAGLGGFAGASVTQAFRFGIARGVYSNEAGTGVAAIAHASAQTNDPVRQGLIAMLGVFIDTILICTATGVALLASGAYTSGLDSTAVTADAFGRALGSAGGPIVMAASVLFGISTLITCEFYGEQCMSYVFGPRARIPYRIVFCVGILGGALAGARAIWAYGDLFSALVAIPSIVALFALSGKVLGLMRARNSSEDDALSEGGAV